MASSQRDRPAQWIRAARSLSQGAGSRQVPWRSSRTQRCNRKPCRVALNDEAVARQPVQRFADRTNAKTVAFAQLPDAKFFSARKHCRR